MSDTPETDAKASPHIGFYSCATVPAEFSRKLERERDEAREALRKCVWWAECVSRRVTEDRESINWTGLQLARKALADIQMEAAK